MATINKTNNTKNAVEIRSELAANGVTIEYIVINGVKCGILGSANEADRQAAIKAIQTALDASDGDTYTALAKLNTIATIEEKKIKPDEMIKVKGKDIIISYSAKAAYALDGTKLATCTDLSDMPNEAIKAVLEARVQAKLS